MQSIVWEYAALAANPKALSRNGQVLHLSLKFAFSGNKPFAVSKAAVFRGPAALYICACTLPHAESI
jgi:hypothetical protein